MRTLLLVAMLAVLALAVAGPAGQATAYGRWWLTAADPPEIEVAAPSAVVRGVARFTVSVRPLGRASVVAARVEGLELEAGEELVVDSSRLPDGPHQLEVEARDHSLRGNIARQALVFVSDNTPPSLAAVLDPGQPVEGRTLVIRARLGEVARLSGTLGGRELRFHGSGLERWAVLGFPPQPAYRQVELRLEAEDEAGNRALVARRYPLRLTPFPLEELEVAPELAPLLEPALRATEQARLNAVYARDSGPPRWRGRFLLPVEGPVTTEFGSRRAYNGRLPSDHHAGTDFAAAQGTPVRAAAEGQVAFSGRLELRGNTVVLDHGAGIYSTYAHLHESLVREGEVVRRGEPIGRVGSTGLSTGPHLHWEVWVGGANVDPLEWTEREIPGGGAEGP